MRLEASVGTVELVPDRGRPGGLLLLIDGTTHGYADLRDPSHLELDYMARIGAALEVLLPRGDAASVLHIGGGSFTLPRFIASTRPGVTQTVIERSTAIVQLARRHLRLRPGPHLSVITGDAAARTPRLPDHSFDLIIGDAFVGTQTPAALVGEPFAAEVKRLLTPAGTYLLNLVDQPPWLQAATQTRILAATFAHVSGFGGREVAQGRHAGNLILIASDRVPSAEHLARRLAGGRHPALLLADHQITTWSATDPSG